MEKGLLLKNSAHLDKTSVCLDQNIFNLQNVVLFPILGVSMFVSCLMTPLNDDPFWQSDTALSMNGEYFK